MGRRGPKFSFPIPGRKTKDKVEKANGLTLSNSNISKNSIGQPEWSPRLNDPGSYSKAERLLGTSNLPFRPSSRQDSVAASPAYMTITVSEASFGSEFTDKGSSTAVEDGGNFSPTKRPSMSNRPSSTILNNDYSDDHRQSNCSSISKQMHSNPSNSTMRSHYDAQNSPLYISQQTSDSAVRDRALRKGNPPVATTHSSGYEDHANSHVPSPLSRQLSDGLKKENRKSKPHKLDLSMLFPKPRTNGGPNLLSPNKLVNSPSAMSNASEFFPRPMTRVPTPVQGKAKLMKSSQRQKTSDSPLKMPTSPVRLHKRDQYDNAKVNVRRPPRGIQHWFDGLGESDEESEEEKVPVHESMTISLQAPQHSHMVPPPRKSSPLDRLFNSATSSQQTLRPQQQQVLHSRKDQHTYGQPALDHRLNSPSQFSVQTQSSHTSNLTKDSAFSRSNLQDSSVLSFSSSEDEDDHDAPVANGYPMRSSIDDLDDGDIIIGKAQALEVQRPRPGHTRRAPSEGKLSIMSTSTNAATIEVMYTPEPYSSHHFPRHYGSARLSYIRPPSVINENEELRPKTSSTRPVSPKSTSIRSAQTSSSEPRSGAEQHKLMAVTAEEEALLEMMRKKRAAMAMNSFTEGYKTAIQQEVPRQVTPPNASYRTSAFLSNETPSTSPARGLNITTSSRKSSLLGSSSPLLMPPRGRPIRFGQDRDSPLGTSVLRDSSSCDDRVTERHILITPTSHPHHLAPPPEFSPLDPFPSSTPTASMASPTTTEHPSPLPSPVTPGHRHGEPDVDVKVAGSEPSCNGDDETPVLDNGIIENPAGNIKTESRSSQITVSSGQHTRRRTASSDGDMTFNLGTCSFPTPPKSHDLAHLPESDIRPPSISISTSSFPMPDSTLNFPMPSSGLAPDGMPTLPRKSYRKNSGLTVNITATNSPISIPRSRHSGVISSQTSSPITVPDRRSSRMSSLSGASRKSSINSMNSTNSKLRDSTRDNKKNRSSVSEDVLAAWTSLGGV